VGPLAELGGGLAELGLGGLGIGELGGAEVGAGGLGVEDAGAVDAQGLAEVGPVDAEAAVGEGSDVGGGEVPANVVIAPGSGYESQTYGGTAYTGGYDPAENTAYLGDAYGHANGMAQAGGNPSAPGVAGLTVVDNGTTVVWNNISGDLITGLSESQIAAVQAGLEDAFPGSTVVYSPTLR
jgi:hypothetical protein